MGKDGGFLTPKAISNRIKSKGMQKLRWYCQSCEKQCRDEVSEARLFDVERASVEGHSFLERLQVSRSKRVPSTAAITRGRKLWQIHRQLFTVNEMGEQ